MRYFYFMLAASSQIATLNFMREAIIIVSLIGPRGGCLAGACDPRVSDDGHHRLLGWSNVQTDDNSPADLVNGQTDFGHGGRNAKGSPATLNAPTGIAPCGDGLAVADAWNYRVLMWGKLPRGHNVPADLVLGENDFHLADHNQSLYWPTAGSLNIPYGIVSVGNWLIAADIGNSRLVAWQGDDRKTGIDAGALIDQLDFQAKEDKRWQLPTRDSLCWPLGVMRCGGLVIVSDSRNNRVLLWRLAEGLTP